MPPPCYVYRRCLHFEFWADRKNVHTNIGDEQLYGEKEKRYSHRPVLLIVLCLAVGQRGVHSRGSRCCGCGLVNATPCERRGRRQTCHTGDGVCGQTHVPTRGIVEQTAEVIAQASRSEALIRARCKGGLLVEMCGGCVRGRRAVRHLDPLSSHGRDDSSVIVRTNSRLPADRCLRLWGSRVGWKLGQ